MIRKLLVVGVLAAVLLAMSVGGLAAAPLADADAAPLPGLPAAPLAETTVMGALGAVLSAGEYQTATATPPALDSAALMEGVNEGVGYGFSFANAFLPLIVIMIGFAVAGGVLGLLVKLGPQIAKMIKGAF